MRVLVSGSTISMSFWCNTLMKTKSFWLGLTVSGAPILRSITGNEREVWELICRGCDRRKLPIYKTRDLKKAGVRVVRCTLSWSPEG